MKRVKFSIFSLGMVLLLAACNACGGKGPIKLITPEDTSMVTEKVKAYVDAMRKQEKSLSNPYAYDDLGGEDGVTVEDFLDEGEVEGKNSTVNGKIPNRSDRNEGVV